MKFLISSKVRGAIGKGSMSDASSYLAKATKNMKRICATEIALEFNASVRAYHSAYVYDIIPDAANHLTDDERKTLIRHSHFKGRTLDETGTAKSWAYSRLFNPLGTMSTAMHVRQKSTKDGTISLTVQGNSIIYQEYGTGTLGEKDPHPHFDRPWTYNYGTKHTDYVTNIKYWVFGQYARIGNPAGHFIYDAKNEVRRSIERGQLYGTLSDIVKNNTKEQVRMIIAGLPERMKY